jgi:N-acetylglutamate synthase-like GNAT family acetyltransferase
MGPKLKFTVRYSKRGDINEILKLVNDEAERTGALLPIRSNTLETWISKGLSLVAEAKEQGRSTIIGHGAAHIWPKSGWIEFRSLIVKPEFRGNGISTKVSGKLFNILKAKYPGATMVAFTNKAGNGRGIFKALGFSEAKYEDLPSELFTIGPEHRGKSEHGYRVFIEYSRQV